MNFPRIALAAKLDGPEFECTDGVISLSLEHMGNIESSIEATEQLAKDAEQKATTANAKLALATTKTTQLQSELDEQTELVSQLTVQLEEAKKAPVGKTTLKHTGAENADAGTEVAHPYAETYLVSKKKK